MISARYGRRVKVRDTPKKMSVEKCLPGVARSLEAQIFDDEVVVAFVAFRANVDC